MEEAGVVPNQAQTHYCCLDTVCASTQTHAHTYTFIMYSLTCTLTHALKMQESIDMPADECYKHSDMLVHVHIGTNILIPARVHPPPQLSTVT